MTEDVHFFVSYNPPLLPPNRDLIKCTEEMKKRRKKAKENVQAPNQTITEKPPVPKHIVPTRPKTGTKNYVEGNVEKIKEIRPKIPKPRYIDYCNGHQHYFEYEVQARDRMNSASYGKSPKYLLRLKTKIEENKNCQLSKGQKQNRDETFTVQPIPSEVKRNLLLELQARREELQREFLCLPFLIDTIPKIKRASRLEKQLQQLEKDIDTLERYADIYIVPDH